MTNRHFKENVEWQKSNTSPNINTLSHVYLFGNHCFIDEVLHLQFLFVFEIFRITAVQSENNQYIFFIVVVVVLFVL